MSLSRAEVAKVALLARLELTPAELDTLTAQLGQIVGYVELLSELPTEGVEPMAQRDLSSECNWPTTARGRVSTARLPSRTLPRATANVTWFPAVLGD